MAKNKLSFSELLKQPVKIMSFIYLYVLVVIIGVGFMYIDNANALVQNKIPPQLDDSVAAVTDLTIEDAKIATAVDIKSLTEPTAAMLDKGKQLFQSTCSSCHGAEGMGDGAAGVALNPKPRNFHSADGWKNGRKVSEIYNTVQKGIAASGMPGFDYLPPADRISIIHFIRTWMKDAPKDTPDDITNLDNTYALSAGTKIAGTIPVAQAEKFYQTGYTDKIGKINFALAKLSNQKQTNPAAKLFFDVTNNQQKALITLTNSANWQIGEKEFLEVVSNNLSENGFTGKIFSLSAGDISNLISLLKSIEV